MKSKILVITHVLLIAFGSTASAQEGDCFSTIKHAADLSVEMGRRVEELRHLEASGQEKSLYGNDKAYIQNKISTLTSTVEEVKLSAWKKCSLGQQ